MKKAVKDWKTYKDAFPYGYEPKENQVQFVQEVIAYRKAGILIEELEWNQDELDEGWNPMMSRKVKITQAKLLNGYLLNQKQLVERAKNLYKLLGREVKVIPVVWFLDTDFITLEWITEKMDEFCIKRKDLINQLAMSKSYVSKLFSGEVSLSYSTKAKFYWYFMVYELNRDLRAQIGG